MDQGVPLIHVDSVSLGFSGQTLFSHFSLKLWPEESLVLVGPSGSGKSTLLRLMTGLILPDQGQVLYRGEPLSTLSEKSRRQFLAEVGMLFQQNALFDSMTVFENLDFVLAELKPELSSQGRSVEIMKMLQYVGLDHVPGHYPGEISGGMQKRLGIARALVVKPRLVFYDDPTAGLDPITSRQIVQLILDLKKELKATIVTVTNDMMRAYQLAGTCMVCLPGEFIPTGNGQQTQNHPDPRVQQFIKGETTGPIGLL